jgi:uncharacterized protein (DUF302 family)
MNSLFVVNTAKSFDSACADLQTAVTDHKFAVMSVHNLGESLRSKGISFAENCCVFEVCHPQQAAKVMECDMALTVALPCRISVYTDTGQTRIAMIRASAILNDLSSASELFEVAQEVDTSTSAMINEAAM